MIHSSLILRCHTVRRTRTKHRYAIILNKVTTMKGLAYVWLPILATCFNFWFAYFLLQGAHAQSLVGDEHYHHHGEAVCHTAAACNNGGFGEESFLPLPPQHHLGSPVSKLAVPSQDSSQVPDDLLPSASNQDEGRNHNKQDDFIISRNSNDAEKDPMLRKMPGLEFEAYVRADIATFYGKQEGSMVEVAPNFSGQAGKFVNLSPHPVALYWIDDSGDPSPINTRIPAFASGGTATFAGHQFIFAAPNKPHAVLCTFTMQHGTSVYYYDPFTTFSEDSARCVPPDESATVQDIAELSALDRQKYRAQQNNLIFRAQYKNFTGGSEWLSLYPRNPPRHFLWRADYFGQEHVVTTRETHFHTNPGAVQTQRRLSLEEMRRGSNSAQTESIFLREYRQPGVLRMTLKALSCAPRVFEIEHFLSPVEVQHLLQLVQQQTLRRSGTGQSGDGGGHVSSTRTSRTAWLKRHDDVIVNAVYRRAADVLRLDEALLRRRAPDERNDVPTKASLSEDLQVVHYSVGQEYTAHHDFGYPQGDPHTDSPSRSINLCMYLNDVAAGGETAFPRWRNAETGQALKVKPVAGKAVIFYMTNPDGNLDDLTQHAALPVLEGEKYFVNLWIHDPIRT